MDFNTKYDVEFTKKGIECRGQNYSGYMGITKLINYGETSFREKMIKQHGLEKATEILSESSSRGNKIHEELETKWNEMLSENILEYLGECKASELFLVGELFGLKCLGFTDALFYNEKTKKWILVDYKTKTRTYENQDYSKYFMQLVAYACLLHKQYGIAMKDIEVCVIVMFTDGSEPHIEKMTQAPQIKSVAYSIMKKAELVLAK